MRTVVIAALFRISWGQVILEGDEFKAMIDNGDFFAILDVRTKAEFDAGHIEGATLVESLSSYGTDQQVATPEDLQGCEDCTMAVYCQTGNRAAAAIAVLQDAGFRGDLFNGQGTIQLVAAGFDLVKDSSVEPSCVGNPAVSEECLRGPVANTNSGNPFNIGTWNTPSLQNREPVSLNNLGSASNPWGNSLVESSSAATLLESITVGTAGNPWKVLPGSSWDTPASSLSDTGGGAENSGTTSFALSNTDPFSPSSWITSTANRVSNEQDENIDIDESPTGATTSFLWNAGGGTWDRNTDPSGGDSVENAAAGEGQDDPWNPSWASSIPGATSSTQQEEATSATSNTNSETANSGGSTWVSSSTWDSEARDFESTESSSDTDSNSDPFNPSWITSNANRASNEQGENIRVIESPSGATSFQWNAGGSTWDSDASGGVNVQDAAAGEDRSDPWNPSWASTTQVAASTPQEDTTSTTSNANSESNGGSTWISGSTWDSGAREFESAESSSGENTNDGTWVADSSWEISVSNTDTEPETGSTRGSSSTTNSETWVTDSSWGTATASNEASSETTEASSNTVVGSSFSEVGSTWDDNSGPSELSEAREELAITNFVNVADWIQSNVESAEPSENIGWGSWTGATNSNNNANDASASSRIGSNSLFTGWTASSEEQQQGGLTFISFLGGPITSASAARTLHSWTALLVSAVAVATTFA